METPCKLLLFLLVLLPATLFAQPHRIWMDGFFEEWSGLQPKYIDPSGDGSGNIDFTNLWISNDADYLFIRAAVGTDVNMQSDNSIRIYLDTDDDLATGLSFNGIGAELVWTFGDRQGTFYHSDGSSTIYHDDIGIVTAPTYSSPEFEISFNLDAEPVSGLPLFSGENIRMVLADNGPGQDELPNLFGGVSYTIGAETPPAVEGIPLHRHREADFRVMSYNVLVNGLFDLAKRPRFTRIFLALQPQIIGFQEIYNYSAQETAAVMETILPSAAGENWYAAKEGGDVVAVSRYPIVASAAIEAWFSNDYNGAFLIDLAPDIDTQLLFIVAHTPCCDEDEGRQFDMDAIMAFLRDARSGKGAITLAPGTPVIISGDMNMVGSAQQLQTLLSGEIINQGLFGPSFDPDWDGSDLSDLLPGISNSPMFFSWYEESNSFSPGRLDFLIYSDSVVEALRRFVLFTPALPADSLLAYDLLWNDATLASDHLPVVGDFKLQQETGINYGLPALPDGFRLEQNYPNPFNPTTDFGFRISDFGYVTIHIYDVQGRPVRSVFSGRMTPGQYSAAWDGTDKNGRPVASGVYLYRLTIGNLPRDNDARQRSTVFSAARKMVLLR